MNNRMWEEDLIGVLAEDDPTAPFNKQSIFINNQESLQFQVRVISQPPESFPNVKQLTCFATYLEEWGFEDIPSLSDEQRKQNLRDFLSESLIVFNPERKLLYNHSEVYNAKNIRLIPKADSYTDKVTLLPFPIFSEESHGLTFYEFLEKLKNRKFVGRIENISSEPNDTPQYVIWKENDSKYIILGELDKHQYAHGGFSFSLRGDLKRIDFQQEWLEDSYIDQKFMPDLMFITLENYQQITDTMDNVSVYKEFDDIYGEDDSNIDSIENESATQLIQKDNSIDQFENQEDIENVGTKKDVDLIEDDLTDTEIENSVEESAENRFLEHFIATTQELGLSYSENDLFNFHTAMKSSNLVILAGMSGTGKSKLVNAYSRALGLYTEQFTFIPVRPSWTDDADLIGYADTLNMVYRPGDSGLINVLKQAEKDEEKLFIICFDEMNLARVEHYFSQFLSILEREPGQREIRLYNDELSNRLYNSAQYPPTIKIKENVMFVGTVNLDESTYHFSDKVLDRSNVIQLTVLPFDSLRELSDKKKIVHSRDQSINFEIYDSFKNKNSFLELNEDELSFLWELHNAMQNVNKQIGIGPRIVRQIDRYLKNLPNNSSFTRREAFDIQIVQRVLTKVRGSEDQLQTFLGSYDKSSQTVTNSQFLDLIEKFVNVSSFENTKKVIIHKTRELKLNGYSI